ncbi:MAG: hypothetical protein WBC82_05405 [Dehalococcoidia bacterium]
MFAFPIKGRHVRFTRDDKPPIFPARVECVLELSPEDIFGGRNRGTPLVLPGTTARFECDANKGQSSVKTREHMKTIRFDRVLDAYDIYLCGGDIKIGFDCNSQDYLMHSLKLLLSLPLYLSLFLSHAVRIDAFYGTIGDCEFNCEVMYGEFDFQVVSEERQKELVELAFETALGSPTIDNTRILAAIGYLYTARLIRAQSPHSSAFLPEVALNLCKALDALFTDNRDQLRQELRKLGFTEKEIENGYVPLTVIRNQLDIAHPTFFTPTVEHQGIFDYFVKVASDLVEEVLRRVVEQCKNGKYEVLPYDTNKQDVERERLLEQLSRYREPKPTESGENYGTSY